MHNLVYVQACSSNATLSASVLGLSVSDMGFALSSDMGFASRGARQGGAAAGTPSGHGTS